MLGFDNSYIKTKNQLFNIALINTVLTRKGLEGQAFYIINTNPVKQVDLEGHHFCLVP